jgi:hypothetical protein
MLTEWLHKWSEWEQAGVEAAGVPISLLRFALAFFASVPVGILFKFVPTVKGGYFCFIPPAACHQGVTCATHGVDSTRPWTCPPVFHAQRPWETQQNSH